MPKKSFSYVQAKKLAEKYNINTKLIPIKWFKYGLEVELEHGFMYGALTNVSMDDPDTTAKIVIAHLIEDPFYYQRLKKMEGEAEDFWKKHKPKPSIFVI